MSNWTAQIDIKWNKDAPATQSWDWMKEWPEVKSAWSTTGNWDMTLWVDVSTPEQLESFVHTKLRSKDWVVDTQSTWTKEVWHAA